MRVRPLLLPLFLLIALAGKTALAANLTADQAKNHIGENATVCGVVASTHYARGKSRQSDIRQPGQAVSQPNLHDCDLGRGFGQVLTEAEYLGRQADLRHGRNQFVSWRTGDRGEVAGASQRKERKVDR